MPAESFLSSAVANTQSIVLVSHPQVEEEEESHIYGTPTPCQSCVGDW